MGKKKTKKKKAQKAQKNVQKQLHHLTEKQLLLQGEQSLGAGKARDAISTLKFAAKQHGQSDEIGTLLFRAYLMRAGELRKKNMIVEADTVKKQAREYMPGADQMTESDLLAFISISSDEEAFDFYRGYTKINNSSRATEQFLANRLLESSQWDILDNLDESLPIRRDAAPVSDAVPLMNEGKWEDALNALMSVSRTSPFAPVRMFCRVMVCFYREEDREMHRAISMLPENFPLIHVAENLKHTVGNGNPGPEKTMRRLQCLWDGQINMEDDMRDILDHLEHRRFARAETSIADISEVIYPRDSDDARVFILEIIWNMVVQYKIGEYDFYRMVRNLLPGDRAELLATKTRLLSFRAPFSHAGQYISILDREFPDPETRDTAHALILLYTARGILRHETEAEKDIKGLGKYRKLLGIPRENTDTLLIDMTTEVLRLDPLNREGYVFLAERPRASRAAKKSVEASLTVMIDRFPDDPWPCLELATLLYEKNAFRKAENILSEAMRRAPYDNRVIDRHVLALLISAEKNIRRKKFHLVAKDIERAEQFDSKKTAPFIAEKRIIFSLLNDQKDVRLSEKAEAEAENDETGQMQLFAGPGDLDKIVEKELAPLSLPDRLRILAILISDISSHSLNERKSVIKSLEKLFGKCLKKMGELSSAELLKILSPLEKEFSSLLPSRDVAPIFFRKDKNILRHADDSEVIPLYDLIFESHWFSLIEKDIRRRMGKETETEPEPWLLLEFYLVTILHLRGEVREPDLFEDIIEDARGPILKEIKTASRRLASHASGVLKRALEIFDFDILDDDMFFPSRPDAFDDEDDFDFFPPFPDDEDMRQGTLEKFVGKLLVLMEDMGGVIPDDIDHDIVEELIGSFETFVEETGLRGAPSTILDELGKMLRSDPGMKNEFEMLAQLVDKVNAGTKLSKEARIVLFGRTRRKKSRKK